MFKRLKLRSKKLVALSLAFVMLLSVTPLSFAEDAKTVAGLENFTKTNTYVDGQFSDVKNSDWFAENVKIVYELGLMNGNSSTTFNPYGNITQAEALAITARIHKIYKTGNDDFSEIKQEMLAMEPEILEWCNYNKNSPAYKEFYNAWYAPYAYYLSVYVFPEAVGEYPQFPALAFDAEYAPFIDTQNHLMRARLICAILIGALPQSEFNTINSIPDGAIPDVTSQDDFSFYDPTVYLLYRAGILTGNDTYGTFSPYSSVTRAEVAAIIGRMVIPSLRKSFDLETKDEDSQTLTTNETISSLEIQGIGEEFEYWWSVNIRNTSKLVSAEYEIKENYDGSITIEIEALAQLIEVIGKATSIQIGYELFDERGVCIKTGYIYMKSSHTNQLYSDTFGFYGIKPGNYILKFKDYKA